MSKIKIKANGKEYAVEDGLTIAEVRLRDGDTIEVMEIVAGG